MDSMSTIDKRQDTRYPATLPVAFTLAEVVSSESAYLNNISIGGVSFNSMVALELGTEIMLHIPVSKPVFSTPGRVVWCRKMAFQYGIGVVFIETDENFRQRMVEVVRRIEEYRLEAVRAGRTVSGQDAALEWIELFGADFFHTG
jgi:Tfp pilus assembly protein PilZ